MSPTTAADIPKSAPSMPEITIYGPEICPNCKQAMALFDRQSPPVPYTKVDIEPGDENYRYVTEDLGYSQAPVIVVDFGEHHRAVHWSGHRMDMLMSLTRLCTRGVPEPADQRS